jgi:hypothetical protein
LPFENSSAAARVLAQHAQQRRHERVRIACNLPKSDCELTTGCAMPERSTSATFSIENVTTSVRPQRSRALFARSSRRLRQRTTAMGLTVLGNVVGICSYRRNSAPLLRSGRSLREMSRRNVGNVTSSTPSPP